jgi:hypothetical protein
MPVTINGSTGITTPTSNIGTATVSNTITTSALSVTGNIIGDVSTTGTIAMASSFKRNRIINGNMLIDQRYAGSANTPLDGAYVVDRWQYSLSASGKFTTQQSAGSISPPAGFTKYLGLTSNGSYSVGSTDAFGVKQRVEGYNVADLGWGTANAKTVTLSFWVYSSSAGTFGGTLFNVSANRFYIYSYTINSTATWEYKTVTIPGDTTGTWNATNDVGIEVYFSIGAGSGRATTPGSWGSTLYVAPTGQTSIVGAGTGAYWYITGVQLEVGTKATPYEMQIYSDQLAQCQRYYETSFANGTAPANGGSSTTFATGATNIAVAAPWTNNLRQSAQVRFVVPKRATPTMTSYGNNAGYLGYISNGTLPTSGTTFTFSADINVQGTDATSFYLNNQVAQAVLFNVAGGISMLGFPATVTVPAFVGWWNWRWLPRWRT